MRIKNKLFKKVIFLKKIKYKLDNKKKLHFLQ